MKKKPLTLPKGVVKGMTPYLHLYHALDAGVWDPSLLNKYLATPLDKGVSEEDLESFYDEMYSLIQGYADLVEPARCRMCGQRTLQFPCVRCGNKYGKYR